MRLTKLEQEAIKEAISTNFGKDSKVWLFGSRVDDSKRGGDIDLYIESPLDDYGLISKAKSGAYFDICEKIGEQKIDITVHAKGKEYTPIERIAKETGVLMQ